MEEADFISNLPDSLLNVIVSLLPINECVRTSVLSQRWKTVWKHSSHLNFDEREMLKPSIENHLRDASPEMRLSNTMHHKEDLREEGVDLIDKAAMLISSTIDAHFGGLKSCRIRHFSKKCMNMEVEGWMRKLLEKGAKNISMERELDCLCFPLDILNIYLLRAIYLPFDILLGFEVLELKNYHLIPSPSDNPPQFLKTLTLSNVIMFQDDFQELVSHCSSLENVTLDNCHINEVMIQSQCLKFLRICNMVVSEIVVNAINIGVIEIDTVFCNAKSLVFKTPKLQVLRSYNNLKKGVLRDTFLTTKDILEVCSGNLIPQGLRIDNVLDNLITLTINLDLKNLKNGIVLSLSLKSCHRLENLEINSQVDDDCGGVSNQNEDDCISFQNKIFWEKELSPGVCHHLKTLNIKGFMGKTFEVEFVKYIVKNVETMEKITIWFVDDSTWAKATTLGLLSCPKASTKLSITLNK